MKQITSHFMNHIASNNSSLRQTTVGHESPAHFPIFLPCITAPHPPITNAMFIADKNRCKIFADSWQHFSNCLPCLSYSHRLHVPSRQKGKRQDIDRMRRRWKRIYLPRRTRRIFLLEMEKNEGKKCLYILFHPNHQHHHHRCDHGRVIVGSITTDRMSSKKFVRFLDVRGF